MLTAEGFHEIEFSFILSVYSLDKNTFKGRCETQVKLGNFKYVKSENCQKKSPIAIKSNTFFCRFL
jgi:hypothetical protein